MDSFAPKRRRATYEGGQTGRSRRSDQAGFSTIATDLINELPVYESEPKWNSFAHELGAALPENVLSYDDLLKYAQGKAWDLERNTEEGEYVATCLGTEEPGEVCMTFPSLRAAQEPNLGKWYFIPSRGETYALAWYICPGEKTYGQHIFGLVDAEHIHKTITKENIHVKHNTIAIRRLEQCIWISSCPPYRGSHILDTFNLILGFFDPQDASMQEKKDFQKELDMLLVKIEGYDTVKEQIRILFFEGLKELS